LRIDSTIETFSPRHWFKIFGQADNVLNYIFTRFSVFCDGHAQPEKISTRFCQKISVVTGYNYYVLCRIL
jgi:hypothetical protein